MSTVAANASALLDAIQAQLGTRTVALVINDGTKTFHVFSPRLTDIMLTGVTAATIIAYGGSGLYKEDYVFPPALAIYDRAVSPIQDRAGNFIESRV